MSVVVTGASGHVGANLVRELLRRGRRVRVFTRRETCPALAGLDVEQALGDVRDPISLRQAFEGAEVVYHLAAVISITGSQGGLVEETNVTGARNVAEAALECRVQRMVHFCSVHAFEQRPLSQPLDEERERVISWRRPAYDRSKAAGEKEVRRVIERGLDAVIVHPTGIIGPHDFEPSRVGRIFLKLAEGRLPAVVPGGFNWVDVRDVVEGALAAEEKGRSNQSYLLPGHWCSVKELASRAEAVSGVPAPRLTSPMALARLGAPFVSAWSRCFGNEPLFTSESLEALRANRRILPDKAARDLSYAPRPLDESIRDVYRWFAGAGMLPVAVSKRASAG